MDIKILFLVIFLAIFSALSVILVKHFISKNIYNFNTISIFIIQILILTVIVISGYFYFILKDISMARFYPMIKIIELLIPVIIAILIYKTKIYPINIIGIILAIIAIICIEWKKK